MLFRTKILATLLAAGALAAPTLAEAGTWKRSHPGRAQVNHRIAKQQVRITREVRQGDMERGEARDLRGNLRGIRQQERAYARTNDNRGHLTRDQVRDLNRQLNANSKAIGR